MSRVRLWAGLDVRPRPLVGGLSHQIWLVDTPIGRFVLRILNESVATVGLGIPTAQEVANTRLAAVSGVGAAVWEVVESPAAVVLAYLPGVTFDNAKVAADLDRIADACRRLHAGPRFVNDFDIFAKRDELLAVCRAHQLRLPDGYLDRGEVVARIRRELADHPVPTMPCHNDLLAANFIDSAAHVRIVDYQLSGNNDPAFELGDIAAEADLTPDQVGRLASAYYGLELSEALLARVRLNLTMSNVTWTLWFAVYHALLGGADPDFDYTAEASDKWGQACRDLDSPELGRLLDTVATRRINAPSAPNPRIQLEELS